MDIRNTARQTYESLLSNARMLAAAGALSAVALTGCGSDEGPGLSGGDAAATAEGANQEPDYTLVLDGGDDAIAADAEITKCGVTGEWQVNSYLKTMTSPENKDLLASETEVLTKKASKEVLDIFATEAIANPEAQDTYEDSAEVLVKLGSRGYPVQMTDAAVAETPYRENYTCDDTDGAGIGDKARFRDIRTNFDLKTGENATLVAFNVTPETWAKAVAAGYEQGVDINTVFITQLNTIKVKNADGEVIELGVVQVFYKDDSCANLVFKPGKPVTPPVTPPETPEDTVPEPELPPYSPPKKDPRTAPAGDPNNSASNDGGTPGVVGTGPAGQTPNTGNVVPGDEPITTQPLDTLPAETVPTATTIAGTGDTVPPITGEQPDAPTAPVITVEPQADDTMPTQPA